MGKPASGTSLDSGNSLYSALTAAGSAVWAMLEGTGSTSADSSGNGNTITLASWATWGTNGSGDPIINCATASGKTCPLTSAITIASGTSWSMAFRMKVNTTATLNTLFGRDLTSNSLFFADDGNFGDYFPSSGNAFVFSGTGALNWTTDADWLLVVDSVGLKVRLYHNGTEVGDSPKTIVSGDTAFVLTSLGSGYDGAGNNALIGAMTYAYLMNGYAATSTDAANLATNPYSIFASGGGGGGVAAPGSLVHSFARVRSSNY